jgi:hypothetical protein
MNTSLLLKKISLLIYINPINKARMIEKGYSKNYRNLKNLELKKMTTTFKIS